MSRLTIWALAFLLGILGVAVGIAGKHVWQDHAALHELAQIEMLRIQQTQRAGPQPTDDAAGK